MGISKSVKEVRMKRRDFVKYAGSGIVMLIVGSTLPKWVSTNSLFSNSEKLVQELNFTITDAIKNMVTHNSINHAQCYFWLYKEKNFPAEVPSPHIFTNVGDPVKVTITNELDEPHAFFIRGVVDSGPIQPGETKVVQFTPSKAGTYLYYDNLNEPVNRMMGLHGALVVMPSEAAIGHRFTPYSTPTSAVQELFDDFGSADHFPGLAWEDGDPVTNTPPFRQYIWILHESSSRLFAEVGKFPPGRDFPARQFENAFLNDRFRADGLNRKPEFFTINGQSGFFSAHNPFITPHHRVGEPVVIRILNAGLSMHSLHIHANHVYVIGTNGQVEDNPLWVETVTLHPLDIVEWAVPFMRPPDVPNERGLGFPDNPLISIPNPSIDGSRPHPVWPPIEELNMYFPERGKKAGDVDISVRLSPIHYPMHDHTENSQTAQGGNYPMGMVSGMVFIGDRNTPEGVITFPDSEVLVHGPDSTGLAAGPDEPHRMHPENKKVQIDDKPQVDKKKNISPEPIRPKSKTNGDNGK
jgi:FtsP/CotA-like multicopper oxidase with cupredoxin domain